MKRLLTAALLLCTITLYSQPPGGFGGWQMPKVDVHCSEKFTDLDYVVDNQV